MDPNWKSWCVEHGVEAIDVRDRIVEAAIAYIRRETIEDGIEELEVHQHDGLDWTAAGIITVGEAWFGFIVSDGGPSASGVLFWREGVAPDYEPPVLAPMTHQPPPFVSPDVWESYEKARQRGEVQRLDEARSYDTHFALGQKVSAYYNREAKSRGWHLDTLEALREGRLRYARAWLASLAPNALELTPELVYDALVAIDPSSVHEDPDGAAARRHAYDAPEAAARRARLQAKLDADARAKRRAQVASDAACLRDLVAGFGR